MFGRVMVELQQLVQVIDDLGATILGYLAPKSTGLLTCRAKVGSLRKCRQSFNS